MRHSAFLTPLTATLLVVAGAASAGAPSPMGIQVMTQNQYVGADLFPLIPAAADPQKFNDALVAVLMTTAANRTADRVKALALEIAVINPHLVGVQEAWDIECIPADPSLGGYPCNAKELAGAWGDHLTLTMAVLGRTYNVAATVENFKITSYGLYPGIPFYYNGVPAFVRIVDRDVILARKDVKTEVFKGYPCNRPSVDGCNYDLDIPLPAVFGTSLKRGFVMVNATVGGKAYRFVNTHLENGYADGFPGVIQSAQAFQLIQTMLSPAVTPIGMRLIMTGDTNSAPDDAVDPADKDIGATPYMLFAKAGLYDLWLDRPGDGAGPTCCQAEDLRNRPSMLTRRVDLIFTREMPRTVKDARLIGTVAAFLLGPPGRSLWPTDHASVAAWWQY